MVTATPKPLYPGERDPVPTVQEAGWAPGPVWFGAENLASTGIRSPERPAGSESLYSTPPLDLHGLFYGGLYLFRRVRKIAKSDY